MSSEKQDKPKNSESQTETYAAHVYGIKKKGNNLVFYYLGDVEGRTFYEARQIAEKKYLREDPSKPGYDDIKLESFKTCHPSIHSKDQF